MNGRYPSQAIPTVDSEVQLAAGPVIHGSQAEVFNTERIGRSGAREHF
jgi:hypothetical protein